MTETPQDDIVIEIAQPGGPEVLRPARRPVPRPGPGELLVRVAAAGVNRPDLMQRAGNYPPPPGASDIPGLEVAGTVAAVGDGVTGFGVGDAVCALVASGGYARWCIVPAPQALPIPRGLTAIEAAALPETFFTVWRNVFDIGQLRAGETALVHGGASGIGTTAIQLITALGASRDRDRGHRREMRRVPRIGGLRTRSTTPPPISSKRRWRRRTGAASIWCSTWSAAITCRAICRCWPSSGATSRSPASAVTRSRSA